jgi:hypothetical protein
MRGVVALLGLVAIPIAAMGQQRRWEHQVQDRMQRAISAVGPASGLPVIERSGMLNTDEAASFQTTLTQGTSYTIVGVCDDDCSRLQLTLVKPGGSEIAKERNSESLPALYFTPEATLSYGIRVVMEGCRWNPCWYAVAVIPLGKKAP